MPYCDKKQVIFLHIPKTGGTTIECLFNIRLLHDSSPETRPSPQHLTCELLRERIGNEKYDSYYKFTFVRNPWARILSSYYWRQTLPKKRPILPFEEFVETARYAVKNHEYFEHVFADHFIPQVEFVRDVDDVFRFENFEAGINSVASRLGVEISPVKQKDPKAHDHYWEFYNAGTRSVISEIYAEEIEKFGYEF